MEYKSPRLEINVEGQITVIRLLDEEILEEPIINEIADALFLYVAEHPGLKLCLSFKNVKHLSSSALGTLIRLSKRVEDSGGELKLCEIRPSLHEVFVITKLNKLFDIYETKDTALGSFVSKS